VMRDGRHAEQSERVQIDHANRFRAANEAYGILGDGERCSQGRSVQHSGMACHTHHEMIHNIEGRLHCASTRL
jgi:hypothetical protein